jgi:hypothetical protein
LTTTLNRSLAPMFALSLFALKKQHSVSSATAHTCVNLEEATFAAAAGMNSRLLATADNLLRVSPYCVLK